MTDTERIQNAISTCIHQMCSVTVGVDDIDAAREYVENECDYSMTAEVGDGFLFWPSGQIEGQFNSVSLLATESD